MQNIQLITLKLNEIKPYPNNPRKNDDAVEATMESISQCGYCNPIVVDEEHVVLAGHTRLRALKRLGWTECQVNVVTGLTEAQKRKFRILDNKTNENAEWDLEKLLGEMAGLDFDGFDFGLDSLLESLDQAMAPLDDFGAFEDQKEQSSFDQAYAERLKSQQEKQAAVHGETFESVSERLEKEKEKPQPVTVGGITLPEGVTEEDFLKYAEEYRQEQEQAAAEREKNRRPDTVCQKGDIWRLGSHILLCGDGTLQKDIDTLTGGAMMDLAIGDFPNTGKDNDEEIEIAQLGFIYMRRKSHNQIVFHGWRYTNFLPVNSGWYLWDKDDNGKGDMIWTSYNKPVRVIQWKWNGMIRSGKREVELPQNIHPAQKPVGLIEQMITANIKNGHTVLDMFGGSGSTLIACELLQLQCFMMEKDEKCCDQIIERWQNLTGSQAVRIAN